jgi:hypothetical protein
MYTFSLFLLGMITVIQIILWIVLLSTIEFESNIFMNFVIGYPWPAFIAFIQIFFGLFKPNIPSYRVINFRGIDKYDMISRSFSIIVTILVMTFGIINTIAEDFVMNNKVLKK